MAEMASRPYPFAAERLDVDPVYRQLRAREPVCRVRLPYGADAWLVTRHADVRSVLADPRFSRAVITGRDDVPRTTSDLQLGGLVCMDPPDHTRMRALVTAAFTHRKMAELRPRAVSIAERLIEQLTMRGAPGDLVADFAKPLTLTVICDLLGIPAADRQEFSIWSEEGLATSASSTPERRWEYVGRMWEYLADLIARRRERGRDDLISAMVASRDGDGSWSDDDLVILTMTVLVAGYETTSSQIPNFWYVLLTRPSHLAQLRDQPELAPAAVEELMRWVPLEASGDPPRYATQDVRLGEFMIRAGEPVITDTTSANRDPEAFDAPERVDFTRQPNPHLGFGHGPHHCLGAQLARIELQVALTTVLRKLPNLRLAVPDESLEWKKSMLTRGLVALPVTW